MQEPHRTKVFVENLDRANQIKALIYSNNKTIDLTETIGSPRIGAILDSTASGSSYASALLEANFEEFTQRFVKDKGLKHMKIKKFLSNDRLSSFYVGRLQTMHDNSVSVRNCTLSGLMAALSEKIIRDLIPLECGHDFKSASQTLLRASSKLSFIGAILDKDFIPENALFNEKDHTHRNFY